MSATDIPANTAREGPAPSSGHDTMARTWQTPSGPAAVSAVNNKPIGRRYIVTGFAFFLLGGILALLMRTQLAVPENGFLDHALYNKLFTMHGTTMLFLFAVPILEGAAIYLLPQMIGARDMAFPRLSAFGYWCFLFGGLLLYSSFLFGVAPDTGWTVYPPLSEPDFSPGKNVDFWLIAITLVEIGSIVAAAEIAVTVLKNRAPGMSLNRMPLFAWYMLVVAFMILFGFPPLILGDLLLEIERAFQWPFFNSAVGGDPLLWQHLFWIFGHPEVYIIFLPAAGMVSMIIASMVQRPTAGYLWLVVAAVGTGFVSFGLWVHHMFATGIPLISLGFFSAASMTVAIFSGIQVFAWLATLWLGKPVLKTPMLFIAGFIFLFVAGGLTGVMHAVIPFDWQTHSSYFLIAHFHYVLIGGMVFPLFAAFHYWFPLETGRMLSETLGKWTFWLLFIGFNTAFFPMHISGLLGMPRRVYTYPEGMWEWENLTSTIGAYLIAAAVLLFIVNFVRSSRQGAPAAPNPWNAGTLEWAIPLPSPSYTFRSIPAVESRYPLWDRPTLPESIERGEHLLASAREGLRLTVNTSVTRADLTHTAILPLPSYAPVSAALALLVLFAAALAEVYWLALIGAALFILVLLVWQWNQNYSDEQLRARIAETTGTPVGAAAPTSSGWWGTWLGIGGSAALLVALVFAYFYLASVAPVWPPAGSAPPEGTLPALGLAGLVLASAVLALTRRGQPAGARLVAGLLIAILLGAAYVTLHAWTLTDAALSPQPHAYGALVYALIGFHLIHIGIGVLMLAFAAAWTVWRPPGLARVQISENTALFWHYVVVMGLVVGAVVYLSPLGMTA